MANEMVERVARASFACWRQRMNELKLHLDKGKTFEDMNKNELEFAYLNARAMIAVMREPTDDMIDAGAYDLDIKLETQYSNMIDAALKD